MSVHFPIKLKLDEEVDEHVEKVNRSGVDNIRPLRPQSEKN